MMKSICFYFQVHQPFRLRTYRFFDMGHQHDYFDEYANRFIIQQLAEKSYLPANELLHKLIKKHGKDFRVSFSISGTALELFELYAPKVIDSFVRLAKTGQVEFLAETYMHSLASLCSKTEFVRQVKMHENKMKTLLGVKPKAFRNTELIYNDDIGNAIYQLGYHTILTEGAKHILGWKSPNLLYCSASNPKVKLLMKNFQLSEDIAFRFSSQSWSEWPLTADKFIQWVNKLEAKTEVVNLFMDYETFGEHHTKESGIFEFFHALPQKILETTPFTFETPSQIAKNLQPASPLHVPYPISWADEERDITAWLGNEMQNEAFEKLYALEDRVSKCNEPSILNDWNRLQVSDHLYYMSTKWFSDGQTKRKLNPYNSPYDAFINYMNVLADFEIRVQKNCDSSVVPKKKTRTRKKTDSATLSKNTASTAKASAAKTKGSKSAGKKG